MYRPLAETRWDIQEIPAPKSVFPQLAFFAACFYPCQYISPGAAWFVCILFVFPFRSLFFSQLVFISAGSSIFRRPRKVDFRSLFFSQLVFFAACFRERPVRPPPCLRRQYTPNLSAKFKLVLWWVPDAGRRRSPPPLGSASTRQKNPMTHEKSRRMPSACPGFPRIPPEYLVLVS